jgi:hypothetical protein
MLLVCRPSAANAAAGIQRRSHLPAMSLPDARRRFAITVLGALRDGDRAAWASAVTFLTAGAASLAAGARRTPASVLGPLRKGHNPVAAIRSSAGYEGWRKITAYAPLLKELIGPLERPPCSGPPGDHREP